MIAVLTADLIDSTSYDEQLLDEVLSILKKEFHALRMNYSADQPEFRIFRGDSFQGVIYRPQDALRVTLKIKTAVNRIRSTQQGRSNPYRIRADFRTALGIGTLDYEGESVSESNGQAFRFSGRTLDEMKSGSQKTRITTTDEEVNHEFNTSFFLMDTVMQGWTIASAEVVYFLLQDMKEREIAERLNISQSAVNQRKKASGWEAISGLLTRYEDIISRKFANG